MALVQKAFVTTERGIFFTVEGIYMKCNISSKKAFSALKIQLK